MNQAETDMVLSMLREMRAALVALSESETDGTLGLLRQIRGELAGIRARLDSLVGIEKQLSYQGGRLSGIEKRLSTIAEMKVAEKLAETKFQPPPGAG